MMRSKFSRAKKKRKKGKRARDNKSATASKVTTGGTAQSA